MNAAADGPDNGSPGSERARLLAEVAELKKQRTELLQKLAECQREARRLRTELEGRNK